MCIGINSFRCIHTTKVKIIDNHIVINQHIASAIGQLSRDIKDINKYIVTYINSHLGINN